MELIPRRIRIKLLETMDQTVAMRFPIAVLTTRVLDQARMVGITQRVTRVKMSLSIIMLLLPYPIRSLLGHNMKH
jgi:hypothetical protein